MSFISDFIAEFKHETASTRSMLERVPQEHFDWAPHAKSMTLTRLSHHVAELPGWVAMTLNTPGLNFAEFDYKPEFPTTSEQLLATFDKAVSDAMQALEQATEAGLSENWTLRNGEQLILEQPRSLVLRSFCMNHLIHHRGQLSVYLRLLNAPVPGMYGPSADEMEAMAVAQN